MLCWILENLSISWRESSFSDHNGRSESRRARGAKCKRTARRVGKCLSAFRIDSRSLGYDDATKSSEREGRKKGAREEKKEEREREREISRIPRRKFLAVLSP